MRRPQLLLVALAALGFVAPAHADYRPAGTADGPTPHITGFAGIDLARDGTGTVGWLKRTPGPLGIGGPVRVYTSRLDKGRPTGVVAVNPGQSGVSSAARIAVGDRHHAVAVWVNGGSLWGSRRPGRTRPWTPPQQIYAGSVGKPVTAPTVDMSLWGTAHAAFVVDGDVRVARMPYWTGRWTALPQPADIDPSRLAVAPDIATSADGSAVVAWAETVGGISRVFARRISDGGRVSAFPREASLGRFQGRLGGRADSPSVSVQDDSSFAFVAFRQDFVDAGGTASRGIARRLRASKMEGPRAIDGLRFPSGEGAARAQVSVGGRADGVSATALRSGSIVANGIGLSGVLGVRWFPSTRLGLGTGSPPPFTVTSAEEPTGVVAWQRAGRIEARRWNGSRFRGLRNLTPGAFGPAAGELGLDSSGDSLRDYVVGFVQGAPTARRVVVVPYAGPMPARAVRRARAEWRRTARPKLSWRPLRDIPWGPLTYQIVLDDRVVGTTRKSTWRPRRGLPLGKHVVEIRTVDATGQVSRGEDRPLWLDNRRPKVSIRGRRLTVTDVGSGVRRADVVYRGGRVTVRARRGAIRNRRLSRRPARVIAYDRAGNRKIAR